MTRRAALSRTEALAELDRLYAELPGINCRGLCHDQCSVIVASALEYDRVADAGYDLTGPVLALAAGSDDLSCPALSAFGRCRAYSVRPLVCRLYGVAEGLGCPHGCRPDRVLPKTRVRELIAQIDDLSEQVHR